jgi:hypothetical protein
VTTPLALPAREAGWRADAGFLARWVLLGAGSGAVAGGIIGGVGGRIAMFVLRLTSSDLLSGALTDDGFEIGVVTFATVELILVTTIIGAVGGVAYVAMRDFFPAGFRIVAWAVACGTVGGSVIITTDGIDFRLLEPLWLAVAMFIAIPAAGGAWTADIVERVRHRGRVATPLSVLGGLALVPLLFGPILVAGPLFGAVVLAGRSSALRGGVDEWWGRALALTFYATVVGLGGRALWHDVTTVL